MALVQLMYAARPDGRWAVLDRGPPLRALVADRTTLERGLTELSRTNAEVVPEPFLEGMGMGLATTSRTTADRLFSTLRRLGAEEAR